jgi:hypothetical protein
MSYVEALQVLLGRNPEEKIQMLYVTLDNGKVLVFLGAPVSEGDADQVQSIAFGERVSPALVGLAASTFGSTEGLYTQ